MSKPGNEVKARLFAVYLGCQVDISATEYGKIEAHRLTECKLIGVRFDENDIPIAFLQTNIRSQNNGLLFLDPDVCTLNLRPIESLTDEEIITVTTIIWGNQVSDTTKIIARDGVINMFNSGWNVDGNRMLQIFDYLRSISIALPFTYLDDNQHPQTASVTEQVEMGWIKLVEK